MGPTGPDGLTVPEDASGPAERCLRSQRATHSVGWPPEEKTLFRSGALLSGFRPDLA